jgi:hypothetical protein
MTLGQPFGSLPGSAGGEMSIWSSLNWIMWKSESWHRNCLSLSRIASNLWTFPRNGRIFRSTTVALLSETYPAFGCPRSLEVAVSEAGYRPVWSHQTSFEISANDWTGRYICGSNVSEFFPGHWDLSRVVVGIDEPIVGDRHDHATIGIPHEKVHLSENSYRRKHILAIDQIWTQLLCR